MNGSIVKQDENTASVSYGMAFCLLARAEVVLLARGAGFDCVVIDMEHGPLSLSDLGAVAATGRAAGLPVYGRVTGPHSPDLARVLDCGATGVIVPHVDSAADAAAMVAVCRFAPVGRRALPGPIPAVDYLSLPAAQLCHEAERDTHLVAMIESAAGLEEAEAIAATPGIDMVMIGTNDLADGLGLRGQIGHPDTLAAFQRVAHAAQTAGCGFGVIGLPVDMVQSHGIALGASLVITTNETNLIAEGGAALLARLKPALD